MGSGAATTRSILTRQQKKHVRDHASGKEVDSIVHSSGFIGEAVWAVNQVTLTFNPMGGTFAGTETGARTGAAGSA